MQLRQHVLDFLASKGGNTTYPELHAATEYRDQRELPRTIKQLRKEGLVDQVVEATPEGNVHKVWRVQEAE